MSAQTMLEKGNYNTALEKAVKRLENNPGKVKHLAVAEQAFNMAAADDLATIQGLRAQGNPANWETIYRLYQDLEYRQNLVQGLEYTPNNVEFADYSSELAEAQLKAAEYNFESAEQLMATNNRFDARKANSLYHKTDGIYPGFRDVGAKINSSREAGYTNVLVDVVPGFPYHMPTSVQNDLAALTPSWERNWTRYHQQPTQDVDYHYTVAFTPEAINVNPEQLGRTIHNRTKSIDVWQPKLDSRGKALTDTLGNVIKEKVCVQLTACVTEHTLLKSASISGRVQYYDNATGNMLKTKAFTVEEVFEHSWSTFQGDEDALTRRDCRMIRVGPAPAPADWDLIAGAGDQLRNDFTSLVAQHSGVIQ